ncbi:hypothetical protein Q0P03_14025, partial [Staphylococcus aureus]|nr:hypothetical protein [Staphylococcus aureus]
CKYSQEYQNKCRQLYCDGKPGAVGKIPFLRLPFTNAQKEQLALLALGLSWHREGKTFPT